MEGERQGTDGETERYRQTQSERRIWERYKSGEWPDVFYPKAVPIYHLIRLQCVDVECCPWCPVTKGIYAIKTTPYNPMCASHSFHGNDRVFRGRLQDSPLWPALTAVKSAHLPLGTRQSEDSAPRWQRPPSAANCHRSTNHSRQIQYYSEEKKTPICESVAPNSTWSHRTIKSLFTSDPANISSSEIGMKHILEL